MQAKQNCLSQKKRHADVKAAGLTAGQDKEGEPM